MPPPQLNRSAVGKDKAILRDESATLEKGSALFAIVSLPYHFPQIAGAQIPPLFIRRLVNLASVRGFIGGESHDCYVGQVSKGRVLTVSLSWGREADNRAEFAVTESPNSDSEHTWSLHLYWLLFERDFS